MAQSELCVITPDITEGAVLYSTKDWQTLTNSESMPIKDKSLRGILRHFKKKHLEDTLKICIKNQIGKPYILYIKLLICIVAIYWPNMDFSYQAILKYTGMLYHTENTLCGW